LTSSQLSYPLVLVNLKTYKESTGKKAIELAKTAEKVTMETGICVAVSPQTVNLDAVIRASNATVFAQHIDPIDPGRNTGHILPEALVEVGCIGTLISHSERRLEIDAIEKRIVKAKEVGLMQVVCVDTVDRGRTVAHFNPDAIAIEPTELIGTGIPVSKAKPEVVSGAVEAVRNVDREIKVLCGAGITSGQDVAAALKLGAKGVLVASGVVKADSPYEKMLDLAQAMIP